MSSSFPGALQSKLNSSSFSYQLGETTIRSNNDVGPAKVRRRFTKAIDTLSCSIDLEYDDWQTLKDFYDTTLNGGSGFFSFNHPFTGSSTTFRFVSAPSISTLGSGGIWFRVSMQWEQVDE